ncbi:MAG TPA: DUF1801 domain-containing protein [Aeromicrobium sp.]|nr:DUF1801 domain-containing protein [Aeromicrobium sp.]
MAKYVLVEDYLAALPDDKREVMERIRSIARAGAANATEAISYNMPALRQDGRFLLSYEAFKNHYSLFPASESVLDAIGDEARRHFSGKGTFQFKAGEPLPEDLIRRIVARLVEDFEREHPPSA